MISQSNMAFGPINDPNQLILPTISWFKDDFLTGSGSSSITTSTAFTGADIAGWSTAQIVGGTHSITGTTGTFANPGIITFLTAASSGQGVGIYRGGGPSSPGVFGDLAAQGGWEIHAVVKLNSTSNVCMRVGLVGTGQQSAATPTGGIYVEYDTANTGNTDTKFTWVTRSAASPTYSVVGAINADTNFHHFRIWSEVAGTINYSVDNGATGSISATVPTVAVGPFIQVITRTAGAATVFLDFFSGIVRTTRT